MGAWGPGAFQNDSASDWVADLVEGGASVRETLEMLIDEGEGYVDVDLGAPALAAVEILAASRDGEVGALPKAVRAWLEEGPEGLDDTDAELALRALDILVDEERSEVAQLWAEAGDGVWREAVDALRARLEG